MQIRASCFAKCRLLLAGKKVSQVGIEKAPIWHGRKIDVQLEALLPISADRLAAFGSKVLLWPLKSDSGLLFHFCLSKMAVSCKVGRATVAKSAFPNARLCVSVPKGAKSQGPCFYAGKGKPRSGVSKVMAK